MIPASRVLNRVRTTLLEDGTVQWTNAELLDYLNSGLNAIVTYSPQAYVVNSSVVLTNNSKQTLPDEAINLISITRNMGADGTTAGEAVRQIDFNHLNNTVPSWHTSTGTAVKHFVYDKRNPAVFYVYPRVTTTWYLELVYAAHPPVIASEATNLSMDDLYENPLYHWILGMCYAKNAKRGDTTKSSYYAGQFSQMLGLRNDIQFAFSSEPKDESPQKEGTE